MKIVYIAGKDISEGIGGHASIVRTYGRASRAAGFEPHIFVAARRSGVRETPYGVLHRIRSPLPAGIRDSRLLAYRWHLAPWDLPTLRVGIERFLRRCGPVDVAHGFGVWGLVGAQLRESGLVHAALTTAYTTTVHESAAKLRGLADGYSPGLCLAYAAELWAARAYIDRLEGRAYRSSDTVVAHYASVERILRASYGPGIRFGRLPSTCEAALAGEVGEPSACSRRRAAVPVIVAVSRHDPRKGISLLIRAVRLLRERAIPVRAHLVGAGPLIDEHRRLVRRLSLVDDVLFFGYVPDPTPFLAAADVFVLPSLEEGSGSLSMLEAMRLGVPVIASAVDGIREDIEPGHDGLLVPPGDTGALAGAIERLLRDDELRHRLGEAARAAFESRLGAVAFVEALQALHLAQRSVARTQAAAATAEARPRAKGTG
jgi:glycosyltransferase involved in cell wall biosynthesis